MWRTCIAVVLMAIGSSCAFAQTDSVPAVIGSCAQDTGPADCPATYQAVLLKPSQIILRQHVEAGTQTARFVRLNAREFLPHLRTLIDDRPQ